MSVNGTLVDDKMLRYKGECAHFCFNKCPIYTHDGASVKFSTDSRETLNFLFLDHKIAGNLYGFSRMDVKHCFLAAYQANE